MPCRWWRYCLFNSKTNSYNHFLLTGLAQNYWASGESLVLCKVHISTSKTSSSLTHGMKYQAFSDFSPMVSSHNIGPWSEWNRHWILRNGGSVLFSCCHNFFWLRWVLLIAEKRLTYFPLETILYMINFVWNFIYWIYLITEVVVKVLFPRNQDCTN